MCGIVEEGEPQREDGVEAPRSWRRNGFAREDWRGVWVYYIPGRADKIFDSKIKVYTFPR